MMRYSVCSDEVLVFRDGRPFGEVGVFGGNSHNWPFPQTMAGMVRNRIGIARDRNYFNQPEHCHNILSIGIKHILPMLKKQNKWIPVLPVPVDLWFIHNKDPSQLNKVVPFEFRNIESSLGTDVTNREWLIPQINSSERKAEELPFFLPWDFYLAYLKGDMEQLSRFSFAEINISPPLQDFRVHNAIENNSLVTEQGKLFANSGIILKSYYLDECCDLAINFTVSADETEDPIASIEGDAYLGGERKRVILQKSDEEFPQCPNSFANQKFLKLVLFTHGDFNGWSPEWLIPDLTAQKIDWVCIPETDLTIRLRSACLQGWDSVSGWDMLTKAPKAMKKLVKPGSVYVIEIKNPCESQQVAEYFWGENLNPTNTVAKNNGYGQCLVGNVNVLEN